MAGVLDRPGEHGDRTLSSDGERAQPWDPLVFGTVAPLDFFTSQELYN